MSREHDILVSPDTDVPDLFRAQQLWRAMDRTRDRPVRVRVAGGVYRHVQPLDLDARDAHVHIHAAPGERPIVDGGIFIAGWEEDRDSGTRRWRANLNRLSGEATHQVRSLFAGGIRRPRARWPKSAFIGIADVPGFEADDNSLYPGASRFVLSPDRADVPTDLADADFRILHLWVDERLPVEHYDPKTRELRCRKHTILGIRAGETHWMGGRCYFENVASAMTEPGEWHFCTSTGVLSYLPAEHETIAETRIVVPLVEQLIRIIGSLDAPATDIVLDGLHLTHTARRDRDGTWGKRVDPYRSPDAWPDRDAYQHFTQGDGVDPRLAYGGVPQAAFDRCGAVRFVHAQRCALTRCRIDRTGGHAVEVGDGCSDIAISGNELSDLGGGGVYVDGVNVVPSRGQTTRAIRITDNTIEHAGREHLSACGVWIGHASECVVAFNHIHDLPYTGISVGWEWRRRAHVAWGNLIERNHIHHIGRADALSDLAGIYTLGPQAGTVLRHNVIHHVAAAKYGAWGIYCDASSCSIVTDGNIVYATDSEPLNNNTGNCENVHRNNILIAARTAGVGVGRRWDDWRAEHCEGVAMTFLRNTIITSGHAIYRVRPDMTTDDAARGPMFVSDANRVWDTRRAGAPDAVEDWTGRVLATLSDWRESSNDRASVAARPPEVVLAIADSPHRFGRRRDCPFLPHLSVLSVGPRAGTKEP